MSRASSCGYLAGSCRARRRLVHSKRNPPSAVHHHRPGSLGLMTASQLHGAPRPAPRPAPHPGVSCLLGRIPVLRVAPCIEHGAFPAKSVVGEPFEVTATVLSLIHISEPTR